MIADMQQICSRYADNHGLNSEAASFMAFVKDLVMRLVKLEVLSLTPRYAGPKDNQLLAKDSYKSVDMKLFFCNKCIDNISQVWQLQVPLLFAHSSRQAACARAP